MGSIMNTSYSLQSNASDLLDKSRKKQYGEQASAKDYRDNFILGNEILDFPINEVEKLLKYRADDNGVLKVAKSVTLKANAYERLVKISNLLDLSESETCRLIIYYSAQKTDKNNEKRIPREVEEEIAYLRKALEDANRALKTIEKYYEVKSEG